MYADNAPAEPYNRHLQEFINAFVTNHPVHPDRVWMTLFNMTARAHRGKERLLAGEFSEFLPFADPSALPSLVELYDQMIISTRYVNFWDMKCGSFDPRNPEPSSEYQKCLYTSAWVKQPFISKLTLAALDVIWTRYYGLPYKEVREIPLHHTMMAHLMNISLHAEWGGYPGLSLSFSEKWEQIKNWPDTGIMAAKIIDEFLIPDHPRFPDGQETDIGRYLPPSMKQRLYMEAWEVYDTKLDPDHHGRDLKARYNPKGYHGRLAAHVLVDEKELFDDSFKAPFQAFYERVKNVT